MRIVTYNLRYDSQPDNISIQQSLDSLPDPLQQPSFLSHNGKERPWSRRRLGVAQRLLSEGITIASFQEALVRQVRDLAELFGSEWSWIGIGRNNGIEAGEFCPIFFKNSVVNLILRIPSGYRELTLNTPFEPSKFPGAGSFRVCTTAYFSTVVGSTKKHFTLLNTHLDDQSDAQRKLGASMLLIRARFEAVRTAYNIITGSEPQVAIDATFAKKYAVKDDQLPGFKMLDLRGEAPRRNIQDASSWSRIDFIFGGNNRAWTAESHNVGTNLSDDGMLESDHRPVFTDVTI
ncbi:hypothetical protein CPB84DRAFT_1781971 [Gymnopilus junonius]|uniref:Endonuclease/exonuclease/phosphatase domain-containing protein n=1 Tax=Gymnopilus junonius TaxID=109634 RepID=A0A9P5NNB0_GYMJU|nr:hypothetical protein CPB84DRAFT_1781971 [Gymnopilus junonius]